METMPYLSYRSAANLIILDCGAVRSYPLEMLKEWKIGRKSPDMHQEITLNSKIVSRMHGKVLSLNNRWYYIDLGSMNGSYLNGRRLEITGRGESDAVELKNGDIIRIDSNDLNNPEDRGVWMMFSTESIGNQWETITLGKNVVSFGRDKSSNDVIIPLPYVSANHFKITYKNDSYYLMDCDSKSGTWVNNSPVNGEVLLREKDLIAICDCVMVFTLGNIIYNIPSKKSSTYSDGIIESAANEKNDFLCNESNSPVILKANIKCRKVPNNAGHGEKELIRNVKVEVSEGSLVALLGGAGAGKSTVMNCMNGMETVGMEGTVEYKGVDLIKNFDRMKSLIGSVPQQETFHESLTVEQELTHAARHRLPRDTTKTEIKERVDSTLKQLGIEAIRKNRISKCSGGEKRRVNIGIELVADRQLLCLDEPDAGLDPGNKRRLFETLSLLAHREGKSILTIIHDVSDIELFDKIIIMNKVDNVGRLAFSGTPDEAKKYFGVDIKDVYQLMASNPEKYVIEDEE